MPEGRLVVGDIGDTDAADRGHEGPRDRGRDALRRPGVGPALDRRPGRATSGSTSVGTKSVLDAMRAAGVSRIVFSSTAATYAFGVEMPIRETTPQIPETPYGTTKLAAEWMIKEYARAYGLGYTIFRYFNASGADPDGQLRREPARRGAHHPADAPGRRRPPREAQDLRRRLGHPRRHLRPRLRPHRRPGPGPPARRRGAWSRAWRRTTTSGSGTGTTILEVLRACEKAVGRPIPHEVVGRRPGDPGTLIATPEKIIRDLGWSPRYPDIESIVATAWRWHQSHPDGYGTSSSH